MTEIPTSFGPVKILDHAGRDTTLAKGDRCRTDTYELTFNGKTYSVVAGACWDSPHDANNRWRLDFAWRLQQRRPRTRPEPALSRVLIPPSEKAWRAIDEAIREHRRAEGYGQPPPEKESACQS